AQLMKIPAGFEYLTAYRYGDKVFNVSDDPQQQRDLGEVLGRALHYAAAMKKILQDNDAPPELYARFKLDALTSVQE
ncbi:UNVERIFIED_CONTAM: sulfatase, partial [Raoultella ornithinolytica]